MRQIIPPVTLAQKILGEQKKNEGVPYRLTTHCVRVERPEGVLLYHTLTGELLLFQEEAALLAALPGPVPPALGELVPRWFLRPERADDMALADQVRQIGSRFQKKETALTRYTIFTTMDCNARCFYCYEAGLEKSSMTGQTARDTAVYIGAHRSGKPVHIRWFGGEPLVNVRAIDIITDSLREQGVEFCSTMTSNGYLFDEALVRRVKDDWKMEMVQITLDGTEEVYNQRKAYVNPKGSPFQRVLRNIGLLLDAGVQVKVRLNMDGDNEKDLYALVDQLVERFGGKSGFGIYPVVLLENAGIDPHSYTKEERCDYAEKARSLLTYIDGKNVMAREPLKNGLMTSSCVADRDGATTVTPEGQLGRCEVCINDTIWGSICSDEREEEVICQWQAHKPPETACKTCPVYPQCIRVEMCPIWLRHCSPIEQVYRESLLYQGILGAYEEWKDAERADRHKEE